MNTLISTHSRHLVASVTLALATLALTGCGGGGGSATVTDPIPPTPPITAEITSSQLDTASQDVAAVSSDIDDSGRVTVLFAQSNGTRVALHAVDGTPGARGTAPSYTAPAVIDTGAPYDGSGRLRLVKSPSGNSAALWMTRAPCTATTYNTSGQCNFVYAARRLSGGAWDAPLLVGDTPGDLPKGIINDTGDMALFWPRWQRSAAGVVTVTNSVVWRAVAASSFSPPAEFADIVTPSGSDVSITLDRLGNMVYASQSNDGTTGPQVLVRRGTVAAGFGSTQRLDSASNATVEGVWGGANGQVVVLWQQASGGVTTRWSATLDTPAGTWQIGNRGTPRTPLRAGTVTAGIGDNGDFFLYDLGNCVALRRTAGTWQTEASLPTGICQTSNSFTYAVSRSGNLFGGLFSAAGSAGNTGQWLSYNAATGTVQQALGTSTSSYLLGTPSTVGGNVLLSENGIAAVVMTNNFDTLPSAATPAGVAGNFVNAWLTFAKLP